MIIPRPAHASPLWWFVCLVFAFAMLYEPTLVVTGSGVLSSVLILSILTSLLYGKPFVISKHFLGLSFLLVATLTLSLGASQLVALARGGDQFFLILLISSLVAYVPISFFVARTMGQTGDATGTALRMFALACFFQSLFIILDWAVPGANGILSSIVVQPDSVENSYRVAGLSSSTGDGLSFRQALGAMAALHLSVVSSSKLRQCWWIGIVCLSLLSMVFVGRTGVILFLVFAIVYGFTSPAKKSLAKSLAVFLAMNAVAGMIGVTLMSAEQREALFTTVLPSAFDFAFSYFAGQGLNVGSIEVLTGRMLFVPDSIGTLLLGDGYWRNPIGTGNYVPSDIGYIRSIYYVGVLGSMLIYIWYGFFWYTLRRLTTEPNIRAFINASVVALFVSHAKFPFLYASTTLVFCFLLFFVLYTDHQARAHFTRKIRAIYDKHRKSNAGSEILTVT